MSWKVVERKIGRAGTEKQRFRNQQEWNRKYGEDSRFPSYLHHIFRNQQEWNRKYGEDNWETGYVINDRFISQEEAFASVYCESYRKHFDNHPDDLDELISLAKKIRNPHAEATGCVDLQIPAILKILEERDLHLSGNELVDIGCWQGQRSHPVSERLSPLQIKYHANPKLTLEKFWQSKKCLAVWED